MVQRADQAVRQLFVGESVSVRQIVRTIVAAHHNKEKPHKGISGGDPFVARFLANDGGAHWTVVADEQSGSAENRKIPFVRNAEGVTCITFQQMILAEGWKFQRCGVGACRGANDGRSGAVRFARCTL